MKHEITVPMEPVESSNLQAIGYDGKNKLLFVQFKGGNVYRYADVGVATHLQFMESTSKGRFFLAHIKNKFESAKIEKEKVA